MPGCNNVELEFPDGQRVEVDLTRSLWKPETQCAELRDAAIGRWVVAEGAAKALRHGWSCDAPGCGYNAPAQCMGECCRGTCGITGLRNLARRRATACNSAIRACFVQQATTNRD